MFTFMNIYIFCVGLLLGSFYNVVGIRIPIKQSIIKPRSHCTNCNHTLTPFELIPVFSYLFLRGKCRKCKSEVSPIYPFMELTTGMLFLLASSEIGLKPELFMSLLLISLLVIISVSDLTYHRIPDKILLFFLPYIIIARIISPLGAWWEPLVGGFAGFITLLVIAILSKGGMGGGDIKLYGILGIILGWKMVLLGLFLSTVCGFLLGMIGIFIGKVKKRTPIPFGPSIGIGTVFAYFWGEEILQWYLTSFY
ncbi:prepilin peptidase (plasmid) [Rossellomorea sp. AcN35-11]|nr:prepilin peptidase [Rossellomorea aquimaris]WJV32353.1 prepilin peptidase [Rossellomorea sp. AcN35-11]